MVPWNEILVRFRPGLIMSSISIERISEILEGWKGPTLEIVRLNAACVVAIPLRRWVVLPSCLIKRY